MSSSTPGPRPRQVTIAGWLIAVASAMLVVTVFDTMAKLHSVDTRDALTTALTSGSLKGIGITVADALSVMRVALFVAGAAAAVTGVLGIFVLQRHASARIVLTVAAVPVVLTAPFAGGFLGMLVGGGTVLLWSRPARDWFAGRPPSPAPRTATAPGARVGAPGRSAPDRSWPAPASPPVSQGPDAAAPPPAPTPGWGQPVPPAWGPPAPTGGDVRAPAYASSPPTNRHVVPTQVRVACVLTWVFGGLTAGLYLVLLVSTAVAREQILDLLRDNPGVRDTSLTEDQLVAAIIVVSVVVVLWSGAAAVLALLAWRRHAWAWITLMVSVVMAALLVAFALPFSLAHLVAAGITLRLLLSERTRAWFRDAGRPGSPGRPTSQPSAQGWPPPSAPPSPPPPDQPSGKPPVW